MLLRKSVLGVGRIQGGNGSAPLVKAVVSSTNGGDVGLGTVMVPTMSKTELARLHSVAKLNCCESNEMFVDNR